MVMANGVTMALIFNSNGVMCNGVASYVAAI